MLPGRHRKRGRIKRSHDFGGDRFIQRFCSERSLPNQDSLSSFRWGRDIVWKADLARKEFQESLEEEMRPLQPLSREEKYWRHLKRNRRSVAAMKLHEMILSRQIVTRLRWTSSENRDALKKRVHDARKKCSEQEERNDQLRHILSAERKRYEILRQELGSCSGQHRGHGSIENTPMQETDTLDLLSEIFQHSPLQVQPLPAASNALREGPSLALCREMTQKICKWHTTGGPHSSVEKQYPAGCERIKTTSRNGNCTTALVAGDVDSTEVGVTERSTRDIFGGEMGPLWCGPSSKQLPG